MNEEERHQHKRREQKKKRKGKEKNGKEQKEQEKKSLSGSLTKEDIYCFNIKWCATRNQD